MNSTWRNLARVCEAEPSQEYVERHARPSESKGEKLGVALPMSGYVAAEGSGELMIEDSQNPVART